MALRAAANFGARFARDAEEHGFPFLAEKLRKDVRELDHEARLAARFEQAAMDRDELRTGAELVLSMARRRR